MAFFDVKSVSSNQARAGMKQLYGWKTPYFPPIRLINPFRFTEPLVVYLGMKDVLRKIKEAEQSAEKRLSSAQTESSKITGDARREASALVTGATEDSVSETQTALDAARSKAGKEADSVQKEGASVVDKIQSSASSRKEKAVKNLLDAVTSQ